MIKVEIFGQNFVLKGFVSYLSAYLFSHNYFLNQNTGIEGQIRKANIKGMLPTLTDLPNNGSLYLLKEDKFALLIKFVLKLTIFHKIPLKKAQFDNFDHFWPVLVVNIKWFKPVLTRWLKPPGQNSDQP